MGEKKLEEVGEKLQKIGCLLTLMFTVPIVLTLFFGIPGLIIGIIIAIIGIAGVLGKKKEKDINKKMKKCPMCAESVIIEAKVCKHCGHKFE
jgi:hypothetical protein